MQPHTSDVLAVMLDAGLPWLSPSARSVVHRLVQQRGTYDAADDFATSVGLRHRHQLRYCLARNGLPGLQPLSAWVRVLTWTLEHELGGPSLSQAALEEAADPSVRYRLVKRLTGVEWRAVRLRGSGWVLHQFLDHCHDPRRTRRAERMSAC